VNLASLDSQSLPVRESQVRMVSVPFQFLSVRQYPMRLASLESQALPVRESQVMMVSA
jgi:hypothetical protein